MRCEQSPRVGAAEDRGLRRYLNRRHDRLGNTAFPARRARVLLSSQPRMLEEPPSARTCLMVNFKRLGQEISRFTRDIGWDGGFRRLTDLRTGKGVNAASDEKGMRDLP